MPVARTGWTAAVVPLSCAGLGNVDKPGKILMTERRHLFAATFLTLTMSACAGPSAYAATCGNSAGGYEGWKQQFAGEARARAISANTIQALMATHYAQATINADRGQRSFQLSLEQFLAKRGAPPPSSPRGGS
jgi:membrane-bound lytic murein transglycosylase B